MRTGLLLTAGYFVVTPTFLFSLIFYETFLIHQNSHVSARSLSSRVKSVEYSTIPKSSQSEVVLNAREARVDALRTFLGKYSSPLLSYAGDIVRAADKYGIDYRLLPAIAMQESTLCEKAPANSYNCWGFGIYGKKVTRFDSFEDAINTVSKTLAEKYHIQGLTDPYEIMTKYTPSNSGEWAENVSYVMERISASL